MGGISSPGLFRKEPFSHFIDPSEIKSFAIYRTPLDGVKINAAAEQIMKTPVVFDTQFDLATNDKMYCTEFVYKSIKAVCGNNFSIPLSEVAGKKYVACDNLFLAKGNTLIYSHSY